MTIETRKLTTLGLRRRALAITRGQVAQDIDILCPVESGGYYCQWVAGHYGACVLGRGQAQIGRRR